MKQTLLVLLLLLLGTLHAEIAPEEYRGMQLRAPEHVELSILSVSTSYNIFSGSTKVKAKAEILSVINSETNLSVGDRITISYIHEKQRKHWAGPRPIPVLKKKEQPEAFLAFDAELGHYVPAARGASFEPLIRDY